MAVVFRPGLRYGQIVEVADPSSATPDRAKITSLQIMVSEAAIGTQLTLERLTMSFALREFSRLLDVVTVGDRVVRATALSRGHRWLGRRLPSEGESKTNERRLKFLKNMTMWHNMPACRTGRRVFICVFLPRTPC